MSQKIIQIDPEGYLMFEGVRVTENAFGKSVLAELYTEDGVFFTRSSGESIFVEVFDAPFVVLGIEKGIGTLWKFTMPYEFQMPFDLQDLKLDDWDRFCGHFTNGVPFVFSRPAQASFFNMLDSFSDTSITVENLEIEIPNKYKNSAKISAQNFWTDFYDAKDTPWDLNEASPVLKQAILQLKLPRQRILVLGAGRGHDAVEFAKAGHVVTAVDFSETARQEFTGIYGNIKDLTYVVADAFHLPSSMNEQFDLVFDHTFFCAIEPQRRRELIKVWKRALVDKGHLLSIFFIFDKVEGPPFGASEWELHQLLQKDFDLLYWTRTKASVARRIHKELIVYASKKSE